MQTRMDILRKEMKDIFPVGQMSWFRLISTPHKQERFVFLRWNEGRYLKFGNA